MKKLVLSVFSVAVIVVFAYAIYCYGFRKSYNGIEANSEAMVKAILEQNDCFVCHSQNPKLPFYSSFPVIGPMMDEHVLHAKNFIDLEKATADMSKIDEVTLSMLEYAIEEETMPIQEYKLIHWGTTFTEMESDVLELWIKLTRDSKFSTGLSSNEYKYEPIQPVPSAIPFDTLKAALGYRMYYDTRISKDGTISCATCHQLEKGGADSRGTRTSEGISGQFGGVNAPTVYNSWYNVQQFWNGRAANLTEQAAGPPVNPVEMGDQTLEDIVARLSEDKNLVKEFSQLYPEEGLTAYTLTSSIAEFEKTLLTPDSRFDQYLKGDENAISELEEEGYEKFKENGCTCCHTGVILGGRSFEYLSIFGDYFADRDSSIVYCADDDGLKGFTGKDQDYRKFKVPGLRNVALTAPYFHDGSMATMSEAVSAMSRYEFGKELDAETIDEIVAFFTTLTGKNKYLK